jgi:hypothetical protein
MRGCAFSGTLLALTLMSAQLAVRGAQGQAPDPGPHAPIAVVELFTSEGCSSCPPADRLLQEIHLKRTEAGQLIVGISEHVTYWNSQGWKDPFSEQLFTDRQTVYASRLAHSEPYTPEMVVNGRDQLVGNNTSALEKALRSDLDKPHLDLQIVSAAVTQSGLDLQYSLKGAVKSKLDIIAIITDDDDRSNVLRGENSGKALEHVSVARMLTRVGTVKNETEETAHLRLPEGLDLKKGSGHHLIVIAQEPHEGSILGAAIMPI